MTYEPVKYRNREETAEALRKMQQRKREGVEKTEREIKELSKLRTTNA
jgi:predicted DNA-binding antitoxin AbrB/MazE fold protein